MVLINNNHVYGRAGQSNQKQSDLLTWVPKGHYLVGMVRPVRDGTGEMAGRDLSRDLRTVEVQEVV